jgi:hypothetical protein
MVPSFATAGEDAVITPVLTTQRFVRSGKVSALPFVHARKSAGTSPSQVWILLVLVLPLIHEDNGRIEPGQECQAGGATRHCARAGDFELTAPNTPRSIASLSKSEQGEVGIREIKDKIAFQRTLIVLARTPACEHGQVS